jgi:hypothetical protein
MRVRTSGREAVSDVLGLDTFFTGKPLDQMANWRTPIASTRTRQTAIPDIWDLSVTR